MEGEAVVPAVGTQAPDFSLPASVEGSERTITLSEVRANGLVVLAFYVLDWTSG
jgi:peroxiredoxin